SLALTKLVGNDLARTAEALPPRLRFVDRTGPVALQKSRQRPIRQQAAAGLAASTVVTFVFCVDDSLNRRPAHGARLLERTVNRHLCSKGRHFLGKVPYRFVPQSVDPKIQRVARRIVQPEGLLVAQRPSE